MCGAGVCLLHAAYVSAWDVDLCLRWCVCGAVAEDSFAQAAGQSATGTVPEASRASNHPTATQQSGWMRRLVGKPSAVLLRDQRTIKARIRDTWTRERFHTALLVFFLTCALAAFQQRLWRWGLLLMLLNVVYNFYPVLLQQYLRLRFLRLLASPD